jgi:hypothetical protein
VIPRFDDKPLADRGGRSAVRVPENRRPEPFAPGNAAPARSAPTEREERARRPRLVGVSRVFLAAAFAAALFTFGPSVASAADLDPCPDAVAVVQEDGTIVCVELATLEKFAATLEERSFQEEFDPTDVASIEALAKELGVDLGAFGAAQLREILAGASPNGHQSVLDVLKAGLAGMPGAGDLGLDEKTADDVLGGTVLQAGADPSGPDLPYAPDDSLYADGDPDDEWAPYPGDPPAAGGGGDAPLAEPSDPPLVAADPPLTPEDPPAAGGPTDPSGPNAPEPSTDPSNNAGNDFINKQIDEHPVAAAVVGLIIQAVRLSTGGPPKMTDPDATGGTVVAPTAEDLERIETKLNALKDPVNPDDVQEPLEGSGLPPEDGIDPTIALFDPEYTGTVATSGETPQVLATAPIDFHPDREPQPTEGPTPASDGDTIHETQ